MIPRKISKKVLASTCFFTALFGWKASQSATTVEALSIQPMVGIPPKPKWQLRQQSARLFRYPDITSTSTSTMMATTTDKSKLNPYLVEKNPETITSSKINTKQKWKSIVTVLHRNLVAIDTLQSAGLKKSPSDPNQRHDHGPILFSQIGFVGHSGLLLVSTILVTMIRLAWKTYQEQKQKQQATTHKKDAAVVEEAAGGVMDRCPWPFIFTHDPVQGLKDPPTWIVITWLVLWRFLKWSNKAKVV